MSKETRGTNSLVGVDTTGENHMADYGNNNLAGVDIQARAWAVKQAVLEGSSRLEQVKAIRAACPELSLGMAVLIQHTLTMERPPIPAKFSPSILDAWKYSSWGDAYAARDTFLGGRVLTKAEDIYVVPLYDTAVLCKGTPQVYVITYTTEHSNEIYFYMG